MAELSLKNPVHFIGKLFKYTPCRCFGLQLPLHTEELQIVSRNISLPFD